MNRRYDIDWLRDTTVLSIIFFHSLIIFFTRESAVMYVRAGVNLQFCIYVEAIMSRFMMPLLFILAGFSMKKSIEKRSMREILNSRVRKLLIPFLVVSLTLNPITSYIYGLTQGRTISFGVHWIKFVTSVSKDFESRTTGYGPMHLWFILFLFVYTIVCTPIFYKMETHNWKERFETVATILAKPFVLFIFTLPYYLIFRIEILDEMNPIGYLYLFLLGYLIATNEKYRYALERDRWGYLILAVIATGLNLYAHFGNPKAGFFILSFATKASRMLLPYAIMGWASKCIPDKPSKVLQYLNQANYPIYLYHMVILTTVGFMVLKLHVNPVVQFLIINVSSYGICFAIYEIYRRMKQKI